MTLIRYTFAISLVLLAVDVAIIRATSAKPWNELLFSQEWPRSGCYQITIQKQHKCLIPKNVTTWTVHGIWPTEAGREGPNFCNQTDYFDESKLKPIKDQLLKYWMTLYMNKPATSFWKHEWTKHGTCAENLSTMNTELKYFSAGLAFNRKYDLLKILAQSDIVPSASTSYNVTNFEDAIKKALGVNPKLLCFLDVINGQKRDQYVNEVSICMNASLELIECKHKSETTKEWNLNRVYNPAHQRLRRASKHGGNIPCDPQKPLLYRPI